MQSFDPVFESSLSREEAIRIRIPFRDALFGTRAFYRTVSAIAFPIILQNTLSNVVNLLDNVMVGRIGTRPMSAVAIVNQMIFVFYLVLFGALTGAGIYGTQFFGKNDEEGVRTTMRVKLLIALVITVSSILIFTTALPILQRTPSRSMRRKRSASHAHTSGSCLPASFPSVFHRYMQARFGKAAGLHSRWPLPFPPWESTSS